VIRRAVPGAVLHPGRKCCPSLMCALPGTRWTGTLTNPPLRITPQASPDTHWGKFLLMNEYLHTATCNARYPEEIFCRDDWEKLMRIRRMRQTGLKVEPLEPTSGTEVSWWTMADVYTYHGKRSHPGSHQEPYCSVARRNRFGHADQLLV